MKRDRVNPKAVDPVFIMEYAIMLAVLRRNKHNSGGVLIFFWDISMSL